MYQCPSCRSDDIRGYFTATITRIQDGQCMYVEHAGTSWLDEADDPVKVECLTCDETTYTPEEWKKS